MNSHGLDDPARPAPAPSIVNVCRILWNGGVQRVSIAQTQLLQEAGFRCRLLFLRAAPGSIYALPKDTEILSAALPATERPFRGLLRRVTALFAGHRGSEATVDLDLLWAARAAVREFDVAIYNDQYAAMTGMFNRLRRRQPYVMMLHELYPEVTGTWRGRLLRPFADLLDAVSILVAPSILTTSSKLKVRLDQLVPGRAVLGRIGCDAPSAPDLAGNGDPRGVVSITVWDRGRHPELYLEIARRLPEFRFILAGGWGEPGFLQEMRSRAAGVPNLVITGPISEEERVRLLTSNLVYMRFGFGESGPGMGGLEALPMGRIVVANREIGVSELLTDGVDGFVVPTDRVEDIVATLRRIAGLEPTALRAVGERVREVARANSWARHLDALRTAVQLAIVSRSPRVSVSD